MTQLGEQKIGGIVNDFRLTAITGECVGLESILRGKKGAVVVFWSGICSHCVRYDSYFNGFTGRHPELGFVTIASREAETPDQLRKTAKVRQLGFPILHDLGGKVAKIWAAQQTPRVFLVDANRVLLYRGAVDNYKYPADIEYAAYLQPAVLQFLSGTPIARAETASFGCAVESIYYKLPKAL